MKVLLDEQLPVKLKYRLQPELEASTVRDERWLGIKNGNLILLAVEAGFSVFITNDQSLYYQQRMTQFAILFINLNQESNRYDDILPCIYKVKYWLLANESQIALLVKERNYLVYPEGFV